MPAVASHTYATLVSAAGAEECLLITWVWGTREYVSLGTWDCYNQYCPERNSNPSLAP